MGNPIAYDVEREMSSDDRLKVVHPNHARNEAGYPEPPANSNLTGNEDFLSDLLDGQQKLISAQHAFLHDSDMKALAAAQRNFIMCQAVVLSRLGVFG